MSFKFLKLKNKILVGTRFNEIYEINEKTSVSKRLISGHSDGAVWSVNFVHK